jgi:copper chaperone
MSGRLGWFAQCDILGFGSAWYLSTVDRLGLNMGKNSLVIVILLCASALLTSCVSRDEKPLPSQPVADSATGSHTAAKPREFRIDGMSCEGCVGNVTTALKEIPGVESAKVSLEEKKAVVVADEAKVSTDTILAAVRKAGYEGQALPPSK